ncbi:MAG: hypothetical protein K0Q80_2377 [Microvirga sp.]|nr:hypothetical protein [Microvirga sp.]
MPWRIVSALSITHLISYGTLFYAFALLIEPMERDLGWSKAALTAAFSLALISSAFFAVPVGRLIDRGYGRAVMTGGSVLAALLLVLWAYTDSYPFFLLIWIGLGAATSALFYEAGFAVLALNLGLLARRGITIITLVAGFASTVFIPLLHVLIDRYGWRDTLLAMAALNIGICAVLHATGIPAAPEKPRHRDESRTVAPLTSNPRRVLAKPAFWLFVITSVLQGIISVGIPVHLIPILLERGFSIEAAVAAYTVIGPAQVAARFLTGFGERAMSLRGIGVVTMAMSTLGFLLLPFKQGLPNQPELVVFKVAQAAVDQLGRGGGGVAGQIALLAEHHREAAAYGIARDAGAVDAAAYNQKISHCRHGMRLSLETGLSRCPADGFFSRLRQANS